MNGDPSNKKNQFIYTLFYSVLVADCKIKLNMQIE